MPGSSYAKKDPLNGNFVFSPGSNLTLSTPLPFTGSLDIQDGASVSGFFDCNNVTLKQSERTAYLTGYYDFTTVYLHGGYTKTGATQPNPAHFLKTERSFIIPHLDIKGIDNTLEGEFVLSEPMTIGAGSGLKLKSYLGITHDIILNEGFLSCQHELTLAPHVMIKGQGNVIGNNTTIYWGNCSSKPIQGIITWHGPLTFFLKGKTVLDAQWTFAPPLTVSPPGAEAQEQAEVVIHGDDNMLVFSNDATITIAPHTTLVLRNVHLQNVKPHTFQCADDTAQVLFQDATCQFSESVHYTTGVMKVDKDSRFIIRDKTLSFTDNAYLVVDNAVLKIDTVTSSEEAPRDFEVLKGNIIKVNYGLVSFENVYAGIVDIIETMLVNQFFLKPITTNITLNQTTIIQRGEVVEIAQDMILDGGGYALQFSSSQEPQFKLQEGVKIHLKNIELRNISRNTFHINSDNVIEIGENVTFTFGDDVTFSKGLFKIVGEKNICTMRGEGAITPLLSFEATSPQGAGGVGYYPPLLDMGTASLVVERMRLKGIEHMSFQDNGTTAGLPSGTLVLAGYSEVWVKSQTLAHYIEVAGLDNAVVLQKDNTVIRGAIRYRNTSLNVLRFITLYASYQGVGQPVIRFEKDAVYVHSSEGQAVLQFDDPSIVLKSESEQAIILGTHGYLKGSILSVTQHPLVQKDQRSSIAPLTIFGKVHKPALGGTLTLEQQGAVVRNMQATVSSRFISSYDQIYNKQTSSFSSFFPSIRSMDELYRGILLPDARRESVVTYQGGMSLTPVSDHLSLYGQNGVPYTDFSFAENRRKGNKVTLYEGVTLVQASQDLMSRSDDHINVVGGTVHAPNTLIVHTSTEWKGNINLDDGAFFNLYLHSHNNVPVFELTTTSRFSWGENSTVMISGNGKVVLPARFFLDFKKTNSTLILKDGVELVIDNGAAISVRGKGSLSVLDGAHIIVKGGGTLLLGTEYNDEITLALHRGGSLCVGEWFESEEAQPSTVACAGGTITIDASYSGIVMVAHQGILGLNAYNGAGRYSTVSSLSFVCGGQCIVAPTGWIVVADNVGLDMQWNMLGGQFQLHGCIKNLSTGMSGRIKQLPSSTSAINFDTFTRACIQALPSLHVSLLVESPEGVWGIYTKDSAYLALAPTQTITHDNAEEGYIYGYDSAMDATFVYGPDGIKR